MQLNATEVASRGFWLRILEAIGTKYQQKILPMNLSKLITYIKNKFSNILCLNTQTSVS